MYRISSGGSHTWEYVETVRDDGEPDPRDKVLARSIREPYKTKQELEDEIRDMRAAKVKWPGEKPK